jgi:hypothetical protein
MFSTNLRLTPFDARAFAADQGEDAGYPSEGGAWSARLSATDAAFLTDERQSGSVTAPARDHTVDY